MTKRLAVAIAVCVTLAACGGDQTGASAPGATETVGPSRDIVEMLEADGRFTTFLRLLRTDAGPNCCLRLEESLAVTTLTVFAPTDAAFASLPPDFLPMLIEDDLGLLRLMENHVLHGLVSTEALQPGDLSTVAGMIDVTMEGQTLVFGGAPVLEPEIAASNGIIHPIDGVATRYCLQIDLDEPLECRNLTEASTER